MNDRTALCVAAVGAVLVGAVAPAWAADDELTEVVVTGFRSSLQKALESKRDSAVAVDVILAEDIGKFPDLNLSESIQRVPGVALVRDGGEGRQISVRGLGATFTRVRINGMEALATTGSSDASGGANRGRSFDFNVFASDLFSSIAVAKTSEAAQEEGSLGATVDLRAARPFDRSGFNAAVSAQAGYNELSEHTRPRFAALVSQTFFDDRLGVLLSGALSRRDTIEEGSSTVRWGTNAGNFAPGFESAPAGGPTKAALDGAFHPRFPRYDHYDNTNKRIGLTGSLQWKPGDSTLVSLDLMYADLQASRREYYLEAPSFSTGTACTTANRANNCGLADFNVTAASISADNVLTSGTFNDVDIRVENRFDDLDTRFKQATLTGEHKFTDRFSGEFLLGRSTSAHDNPIQTTLTFDQFNIQGYKYDYSIPRSPLLNYGTTDVTGANGWVLRELRERKLTADNEYESGRTSLKFAFNDSLALRGGVDYKRYEFNTTELRRVDANGSTANVEVFTAAQIATLNAFAPLSSYTTLARLNGSGLNIPAGTPLVWLVPDLDKAYSLWNINDQTAFNGLFKLGAGPALTNNKGVEEKDSGAFVQFDFRTELLSVPLRGNFGVRYVKTRQESAGYTFVAGAITPLIAKNTYSDTLPSVNLVAEPMENLLVRFGAGKTMARAELTQLSPGAAFNVAGSTRAVTAGNPDLAPIRSTNVDLSAEWYFQPGSLLSVAVFQKDLSSFVQNITTNQTYAGNSFGLPDSAAIAACGNQTTDCNTTTTTWAFTAPKNTPGDKLKGYEVNYQQSLKFLPSVFSNLGVLFNYTAVSAKVNYVNALGAVVARQDLTNLSPHSYNATLYYEDKKLSARVSAAYRSRYLTTVPGTDNTAVTPVLFQGTNSTLNVDASIQYSVTPQLKVSLEGINLTDEFQDQFIGVQDLESVYHHTGSEYILGVRFSF